MAVMVDAVVRNTLTTRYFDHKGQTQHIENAQHKRQCLIYVHNKPKHISFPEPGTITQISTCPFTVWLCSSHLFCRLWFSNYTFVNE